MIYFTGTSNEHTRSANRSDLGVLGTPAGSTWVQKTHYATWAADNGHRGLDGRLHRSDYRDGG